MCRCPFMSGIVSLFAVLRCCAAEYLWQLQRVLQPSALWVCRARMTTFYPKKPGTLVVILSCSCGAAHRWCRVSFGEW